MGCRKDTKVVNTAQTLLSPQQINGCNGVRRHRWRDNDGGMKGDKKGEQEKDETKGRVDERGGIHFLLML